MKRILIVEDDVEFRDVLAECLVDAGYEVETTDNGLTARRLLELYGFDLVLSDWRMPGFGGLDLLCYVKQHLRTPFILMTGFGDFLAPSDVYESGAVSFLPKPFDRRDLILELETVLAANNPEISIDPLYQQVDSQVIRACERLPVDLFLKIAAGKYMKVAHRGSPL
ncbi:MAG TPA: response regulator, partial [Bdellovibrionales bacterium]|nr:response regulator [Bdellovibrionales bacterium]